MKLNITALLLWILCAVVGYLLTGTLNGALIGLAWSLSASLCADIANGLALVPWAVAFIVWLFW